MKQRFDIAIVLSLIVFLTWLQQPCNGVGIVVESENCRDARPTDYCKLVFDDRLENCIDSSYWGIAKNCRVTCKNCSDYNCANPLPEAIVHCDALESKCDDPLFGPLVQKKCPAICGTCKKDNSQLCKDVSPTETCVQLKAFCDTQEEYAMMTAYCPSTCKRCPANVIINGQCMDAIPNCHSYLQNCNDPAYDSIMQIKCNKTCNKCSTAVTPITPAGHCVDNSACATWITSGFCTNPQYSVEDRRKYCPVACNLCP